MPTFLIGKKEGEYLYFLHIGVKVSLRVWTCWFKQSVLVKDMSKEERHRWHAKKRKTFSVKMSIPTDNLAQPSVLRPPSCLFHSPLYQTVRKRLHCFIRKGESILRLIWDLNWFARIMFPKWPGISLLVKILPNSNLFFVLFPLEDGGCGKDSSA